MNQQCTLLSKVLSYHLNETTRIPTPGGSDAHEIESQRMYDEAYSLAFAQQLKNKDIPEGGSKAVCLVRPGPYSKEDPKYLVRKSVKAFGDALLDLHSTHEETKSRIVDWYVGSVREFYSSHSLLMLIYLALECSPKTHNTRTQVRQGRTGLSGTR